MTTASDFKDSADPILNSPHLAYNTCNTDNHYFWAIVKVEDGIQKFLAGVGENEGVEKLRETLEEFSEKLSLPIKNPIPKKEAEPEEPTLTIEV